MSNGLSLLIPLIYDNNDFFTYLNGIQFSIIVHANLDYTNVFWQTMCTKHLLDLGLKSRIFFLYFGIVSPSYPHFSILSLFLFPYPSFSSISTQQSNAMQCNAMHAQRKAIKQSNAMQCNATQCNNFKSTIYNYRPCCIGSTNSRRRWV